MPTVNVDKYTMPAANLGGENPLPRLSPRLSATSGVDVDDSVPIGERKFFGYGLDAGWLPHRDQDDFDRVRHDRDFLAITLENEYLRATILPEIGGRLWSLVHRPTNRELLHINPVFQPANLAVRGAWVAGGVEWNACVYGHSPYNCSSMFAALVEDQHAGTIVRIYEWDRTRCVPYQIDISLPDGSPFLFVRVQLFNPHSHTIPMYWWSNIAVPETPDVRVLVPAERAYTYEYWGQVHSISVPRHDNVDVTYPTNLPYAGDYFFRIPDTERPWIAALDRTGSGLVQISTARQMGRKLFAWGSKAGGRRWKEFLATPGHDYFEIQAGIARTQMECSPMPASARWEWMEAYGMLQADPAKVHGPSWNDAVAEVSGHLDRAISHHALEAILLQTAESADRQPTQIVHRGSGWGALERIRREQSGERPFCGNGLVFDDDSLGDEQTPWLLLLRQRRFPTKDPKSEPGAFMTQPEWRDLLKASIRDHGDDWLTLLHLGLMYYCNGNGQAAEAAWRSSLERTPNGWAYRNLAMSRHISGRTTEAISFYRKSIQLLPDLKPLLVEFCEALLAAGQATEAIALFESAPVAIRDHSRVRMLKAAAGLAMGRTRHCLPLLNDGFELVDIREGETSLSDIWFSHINDGTRKSGNGASVINGLENSIPPHLNFQVMPYRRSRLPAQEQRGDEDVHARRFDGSEVIPRMREPVYPIIPSDHKD